MKAVRSVEGGVAVVELDEPPGLGELLDMRSTSICGSDLSYIRFGSRAILGHELAGVREDGTAVVVEAIYGCMECASANEARTTCAPPMANGRSVSVPTGGWPSSSAPPTARLVPLPPGLDVHDASSRGAGRRLVARARAGRNRSGHTGRGGRGRCVGVTRRGRRPPQGRRGGGARGAVTPTRRRRASAWARASAGTGSTTSSSRRREPRRAWPNAANSSHPAGRSSSSASISGRCSSMDAAVPQGGQGRPVTRVLRPRGRP